MHGCASDRVTGQQATPTRRHAVDDHDDDQENPGFMFDTITNIVILLM